MYVCMYVCMCVCVCVCTHKMMQCLPIKPKYFQTEDRSKLGPAFQ